MTNNSAPSHTFTIEGELIDLNTYISAERTNRFEAAKIKKNQTAYCERAAFNADIEYIDKPVAILFVWYLKDKRKDLDNVAFAQKFIFDGMVEAGVLETDGQRVVQSITHHIHTDKAHPRVEVFITPI